MMPDIKEEPLAKITPKLEFTLGVELAILEKKIRNMVILIKEELTTLDVEFLHMRALSKQGTIDNTKPAIIEKDEAMNYDDTNINYNRNFNLAPLETLNNLVEGNVYMEEYSESD